MNKQIMIYKVGGAVRDRLLGQSVKDIDWVVVGATAEQMLAKGFQPVGADFPVFLHPQTGEEYALARTERKTGKGYGGFAFFANQDVTLEQDLARRDLTINAIAEDDQGNLYDPYHGQQDLAQKTLRHVSDAFIEDPLRVLRVARFAARYAPLGFTIAEETKALMTQLSLSGELNHLTAERVWKEFSRALLENEPAVFINVLHNCQALDKLLPQLQNIPLIEQLLTQSTKQPLTLAERYACLIVPLALDQNLAAIKQINQHLKVPNDCADLADLIGRYLTQCQHSLSLTPEALLKLLKGIDVQRRPERLHALLTVVDCVNSVMHINATKEIQLITEIAQKICAINPQQLIAEGLQGAALGKAINQQQLKIIEQTIANYIPNATATNNR